MVVGSDRVDNFHSLLNKYRTKEYPGIKKVNVVSAGHRDPDAEGAEGMSASKLRGLVTAGKKDEFVSHYSDPKLGAHIHDKVKAGMQMESVSPVGIFLLGGPGSGKDYVLKNIFSRFDLTEVQVEHILNGSASELIEQKKNIVINGALDESKIQEVKTFLEGYDFDSVYVHVTNKVSRLRNSLRDNPLVENKRLEKWYRAEKLAESLESYKFNNSINLNESSDFEKVFFASEIEKLLERIVNTGLEIQPVSEAKTFAPVAKHKSGLPKKYVGKLSDATAAARKAHWKKMSKYSDRDPRAYKPAPGDATSKTKPSKHTLAVRKMMDEQVTGDLKVPHTIESIADKHGVSIALMTQALKLGKQVEMEHTKDEKTAEIIALGHLWEKPDYYDMLKQMEQLTGDIQSDLSKYAGPKLARKIGRQREVGHFRDVHRREREAHKIATEEVVEEGAADSSLAAKAKKSGVSVSTLRKVYRRGVAAWNSGHRPGTTPSQWGHARVNSYINKGKTYHTADKDLREEADINELFEMQLFGTNEYRKHAIAMTPGQKQDIDNAPKDLGKGKQPGRSAKSESVEAEQCCPDIDVGGANVRTFRELRSEIKEAASTVDSTPPLNAKKTRAKGLNSPSRGYRTTLDGMPVASRLGITEETTLEEAVEYHLENKISFTENVFRPGSNMFFEMISEAKRLYAEGKYTPADEWEKDMLESNIGERVMFEGQEVILDYPFDELDEACWDGYKQIGMKKKGKRMVPNCVKEDSDPTNGKGIGKPWREGGGGAVYVRDGGSIRKVRFSQSGMKKKFMDPGATRSFVARHHCLTNKDKTSASYWACRWPRFFSNSGKTWW
jgi:hypothetical protein